MYLAPQWGDTLVTRNPCAARNGAVRAGCCGKRRPSYSEFGFVNIMGFIHKMKLKHPFTMAICLPRHRSWV